MRFQDKICIVSGGASGIGKAAADRFTAEGGHVVVADLHGPEGQRCDVGNPADIKAVIQRVIDKWGHIDVVVNDAAMMTFLPILELPDDQFDKVLNINLRSVFLFCKYAVPHMPKGSAIVNISSVHAHETTKNVVPYATSKGGMEAFTRGFAEELGPLGIRINCVAPGAVDTPMLWNNPNVKSGVEKIDGAVGKPADIAAAICFLASAEARFITGTTLIADGGRLDILA